LTLKKISDLDEALREDIIFAKRTEEALKRYERGLFKEMDDKNFLKAKRLIFTHNISIL
jgi:hypothetical protein